MNLLLSKRFKIFLFFVFLFSICFQTNSYAIRTRKILVLHSYHIGLSWTQSIISGINEELDKARNSGMKIHVDYEYMDTKRFVGKDYYKILYNLYKYKAKKLKYDVIISADDNALNFLLKDRDDIFDKVPVAFCGVNYYKDDLLKKHSLYTGVVEAFNVGETFSLIMKQFPETKKIYVIGDGSTSGLKNKFTIQRFAKQLKNRSIKFIYLNNGKIYNYQKILGNLSKGSVVLAMLFNRDDQGNFYTYEQSMEIYCKDVKVPVYSFWDFYLNHGILGGSIISGQSQGREVAKLAIQILMGEHIKDLPVLKKSPNQYMFDYTYMKKFNINLSSLPDGSLIINKPISYFGQLWKYRLVIFTVLSIILFLVVVIVVLTINILRRKKLQSELLNTNHSFDRFVPHEFLENLEKDNILDVQLGDQIQKEMTVLFSDIRSFTELSEQMTPEENFKFLNSYLKVVSPVIRNQNGFIDKYIGDAIMAIFPDSPEDAVASAVNMQQSVIEYNLGRKDAGYPPIQIGIGLHFGSLMMGTIGEEQRMEGTVISDTVNLASRLEGLTKQLGAKIIISGEIFDSLEEKKAKYNFRYLGDVRVKGKHESVKLFEVITGNLSSIIELKLKTKKVFEKAIGYYKNKKFDEAIDLFEKILKINKDDLASSFYLNQCKKFRKEDLPEEWNGVTSFESK